MSPVNRFRMIMSENVNKLMAFLDASPVNFLAVKTAESLLQANGFKPLDKRDAWVLQPGDRRYIVKNSSALMAVPKPDSTLSRLTAIRPASASSPEPR